MKNHKNKLGYALYILLACALISCGTESFQISKEEPFVVAKITLKNGMYKYERENFERPFKEIFAIEKQSITVDYNLNLQVGDTLRIYARQR